MTLDLSSLRKAIDAFERSLRVSRNQNVMANLDEDARDTIKAGVIHNFKVAYICCSKYIQRWVKENAVSETDYLCTRKQLFRLAAQNALINDPAPWFSYGDARNQISQTYTREKTEIVYDAVKTFVDDAKQLLKKLEKLNN